MTYTPEDFDAEIKLLEEKVSRVRGDLEQGLDEIEEIKCGLALREMLFQIQLLRQAASQARELAALRAEVERLRPKLSRAGLARLICYWMPAPPHATCHDNICVGKCLAKPNPEHDLNDGHLIKGLIDALIAAGVAVAP